MVMMMKRKLVIQKMLKCIEMGIAMSLVVVGLHGWMMIKIRSDDDGTW